MKKVERRLGRKCRIKSLKESFLIITEGINSEPEYLRAFRVTSAKILGQGMNSLSLVKKAINIKRDRARRGEIYDHYWVVFDKDDISDEQFNDAIDLAIKNSFKVAYSNQAFEYWCLLHFEKYVGHFTRNEMNQRLSKLLNYSYNKQEGVGLQIYHDLLPLQELAIERAKEVYEEISHGNPAKEESSTTVFSLVEELRRFV